MVNFTGKLDVKTKTIEKATFANVKQSLNIYLDYALLRFKYSHNSKNLVKKIGRTSVLFVGPLILVFWTSGDICPGFQR